MGEGKKPNEKDVSSVRLAAVERVSSVDPRAHAAWRTWLSALATDADAATAAALAYESLPFDARDAWLDALDADADDIGIPEVALYAPLLGVEEDDERRVRIARHVEGAARVSTPPRAYVGTRGRERVCVILTPLYLDFVELLLCRYDRADGVREALHDWLAHKSELEACAREMGVKLEEVPLSDVVEELAHAIVADRRAGRASPDALVRHVDLFAPDVPVSASLFDE